ncbi:hypothetical protein EYW49_17820 [Siculibacillus lacustris]|uniref:Fibronectin type III-like domain-containing protein n=1 Tax=Siculibacillus lacustris TaxID=1549641 RepID=A0A4V2KSW5_9HYPH|nr:glycoside hydrolase family 3 C-terminal domain-containing protein [Siculibacillus lacustris]TBW34605.1 hypothetical protein EYW49_17820 [Siculibacillus lacustris]
MTRIVLAPLPARARRRGLAGAIALLLGVLAGAAPLRAAEVDVGALVAAMSLEEKLAMVRGAVDPLGLGGAGYIAGVPRHGIPPLRTADGPAGIEARADATALPSPEALAASFDPGLAERYGRVLGREARALGMDVVLGPHVNIARLPVFHRVKDEFGEDPLLTARIGAAEIRGIQAEGAMAMVKHLAANDQFHGQDVADFRISERALAEIHLPPFEAAVREAGVASVMCAYNRVNGPFSCAQRDLLTTFLRDRWGFDGFVTSDWDAARAQAFGAGLDVEMPGTTAPTWYGKLAARGARDPAAMERLDRAVTRVLVTMRRFGLLAGASPWRGRAVVPPRPVLDRDRSAAVAREVATRGAVLLKNDDELLPLGASGARGGVLLVGATAAKLAAGAGVERAYGFRDREVSPLDALRATLGPTVRIDHRVGIDLEGETIPAEALTWSDTPDDAAALAARSASPSVERGLVRMASHDPDGEADVDSVLDFTGAAALPAGGDWTWAGLLTVPTSGVYDLMVETSGGRAQLQFADRTVSSARIGANGGVAHPWSSVVTTADGLDVVPLRVRLAAGHHYQIRLTASAQADTPLELRFAWVTPQAREKALREAVEAARSAATVVVFAHEDGLPPDRDTLALPRDQDALIAAIAAVNPRTAVVLATGRPVTMPWLSRVKAVLLGWYPGQEGGWALADLLAGRASPSGRLPLTFPVRDDQTLATGEPQRYRGLDEVIAYDEGVFVGYRWYDERGEAPLFPFGHGLGYGRFAWSDAAVSAVGDGFEASVTVRNVGTRTAADVVQVYLARPETLPEGLPMPPRALAGFARVELPPGGETRLTIPLERRRFEAWSEREHGWRLVPGTRVVEFAASSRDVRLTAMATPRP